METGASGGREREEGGRERGGGGAYKQASRHTTR